MLKIKNLGVEKDGKKILNGVNLEVKKGEIHAILGPNGGGKSTLGRAILGDENYEISDGEIFFSGKNVQNFSPDERARMGFFLSFQSPPVLEGVSGLELLFAAKKNSDPKNFSSRFRFQKALQKNLAQVRLSSDFSAREMNAGASGGERKKMEMASLLALDPACAFLDEIDSGVDVDSISAIAEGFYDWFSDEKSAILVSHSEKLLQKIKPHFVHILCSGRVAHSGGIELLEQVHEEGFEKFCPSAAAELKVV